MSLRRYSTYSRSGHPWLCEIPAHWRLARLKYLSSTPIRNGVGEPGTEDNPAWPRYIRITDISGPRALRDDTFRSLPPEVAAEASLRVGDLLFAAVGASYGKSYLHTNDIGPACFAGFLVRFSPGIQVEPAFVAYWSETDFYTAQVESRVVQATIQNFSASKFRDLVVPIPQRSEQLAIVSFLDCEVGKIDALIAEQQRLIELLKEKLQVLISCAVTKGLDPDAPTKPSGVEWLRLVPADWAVTQLRYITRPGTSITYGIVQAGPHVEGGVPYIKTSDMSGDELPVDGYARTSPAIDAAYERSRVSSGDIVVGTCQGF